MKYLHTARREHRAATPIERNIRIDVREVIDWMEQMHGVAGLAAVLVSTLAYVPLFLTMRALKSVVELASFGHFTIAKKSKGITYH